MRNRSARPTADLVDDFADRLQSCELQFQRYGKLPGCSGQIATVSCFQDNLLVRDRLSEPGEGRVLVVDGAGSLGTALLGDRLAELGRVNGWSGVIVYGAIRDSAVIAEMDVAVKALGTNPRKSQKAGKGEVDVPVTFGTVTFVPGHWLVSDADGIVVCPEPFE